MTDRTTLPIGQFECRVLVASNISMAAEIANKAVELSREDAIALTEHLDRAKTFAIAWYNSANKPVEEPVQEEARVEPPMPKRGGWPKGKPRGPRKRMNPAEVMQ